MNFVSSVCCSALIEKPEDIRYNINIYNMLWRRLILVFDINKKIIPIGISDYKKITAENYYYVDKTKMLKDIIDYRPYVNLFTRPRRFGKTLNLSMIKYFLKKQKKTTSICSKTKKSGNLVKDINNIKVNTRLLI